MNQKPLGVKIISGVWCFYASASALFSSYLVFKNIQTRSFTLQNFAFESLFILLALVGIWIARETFNLKSRVVFFNVSGSAGYVTGSIFNLILKEQGLNAWQIINICYSLWVVIYFLRPQTKALFQEKT